MLATRDIATIYIVDEEEALRKGLSRLLRSMGMPCRDFASAEEFLAELNPQQKCCVLLDITMPRLTGLQLQDELKKRKINLPIIVVSANDDADTSMVRAVAGNVLVFSSGHFIRVLAARWLGASRWLAGPGDEPGVS